LLSVEPHERIGGKEQTECPWKQRNARLVADEESFVALPPSHIGQREPEQERRSERLTGDGKDAHVTNLFFAPGMRDRSKVDGWSDYKATREQNPGGNEQSRQLKGPHGMVSTSSMAPRANSIALSACGRIGLENGKKFTLPLETPRGASAGERRTSTGRCKVAGPRYGWAGPAGGCGAGDAGAWRCSRNFMILHSARASSQSSSARPPAIASAAKNPPNATGTSTGP
jgi:hypothetical protein